MNRQPPKWIDRILEWYCHPAYLDEIKGDLYESFWKWDKNKGPFQARVLYAINTLFFMRMYNSRFGEKRFQLKTTSMLTHLLRVSYRNFRKHKTHNLANILGLTVGVAISLIMLLHIQQELSYEKTYPKHERIARVSLRHDWAKSSPVLAEEIQNYFSDLESVGRFARYGGVNILSQDNKKFISKNIFQADQQTINIFDFEFVHGNPAGALERPQTMILTEKAATALFGDQNPIGKTIEANETAKFEVTGVIKDLPENSHIKSDALISMSTFYERIPQNWTQSRGWMVMYTYVLMRDPSDFDQINAGLTDFLGHYSSDRDPEDLTFEDRMELMKLTDIHLHSDKIQEMGQNSSVIYIYVFCALAIIIILIACVNFVNIFTTLALKRAKEVGIRRIIGATKKQLVIQLLSEAILSSFLAFTLGLGFCLLALPFYNTLVEFNISPHEILILNNLLLFFTGAFLLGVISGLYPALLVTQGSTTATLISDSSSNTRLSVLRKSLIVFQFILSTFILISTVAVNQQMNFIQTKDAGYDVDKVAAVRTYGKFDQELNKRRQALYGQFRDIPGVKSVATSSDLIGEPLSKEGFELITQTGDDNPNIDMIWVDENYLNTMGIELLNGRGFLPKQDTSVAFIVNEKLVELWGDNPVGEMAEATTRGDRGPIVGVIKDYHYYSMHKTVDPLVLCYKPQWTSNLLIKMEGDRVIETLTAFEKKVKESAPETLFHYNFLNDQINSLYRGEHAMFRIFKVFSLLALIISCVGLLGLASMEAQRRTKEVGIRKVLGASGSQLLRLLNKQFMFLLLIAVVVGIPTSYLAINEWLSGFSYQISLSWWIFAGPSAVLILLALLIVTVHVMKTVKANPVESLHYE
ncbi:MAG: FtsX-like permease family protein [Cyclobacteriaceae bacterium]